MRRRFTRDPQKILTDFYKLLGTDTAPHSEHLNQALLLAGLDELRDGDVQPALSSLAAPGLVLASRNDPLVPETTSEELTNINSRTRILWHETGGHMLPQTDPVWCASHIKDFVTSLN